jgi:hypothetical protein
LYCALAAASGSGSAPAPGPAALRSGRTQPSTPPCTAASSQTPTATARTTSPSLSEPASHATLGFDGGIVGGPWIDGNCLYFHATTVRHVLPTDIYRRCGSLQHPGKPELVVGRTQSWEVDQVADATIARAPGHRPLMLFSGLDNMRPYAAIGAAWLR